MSESFVNVVHTNDNQWAVEFDGKQVAFASRGAAISAGVHKAIEESAFLMIHEREADASVPV